MRMLAVGRRTLWIFVMVAVEISMLLVKFKGRSNQHSHANFAFEYQHFESGENGALMIFLFSISSFTISR